jgi:hypothetical protein
MCGDNQVIKVPSASYVNTGANDRAPKLAEPAAQTVTPEQAQDASMRSAMLAKIVEYVVKNTEDVGKEFPEEARKIHYGESPERKIRGTASSQEITELRDEGIDVMPLPVAVPASKKSLIA